MSPADFQSGFIQVPKYLLLKWMNKHQSINWQNQMFLFLNFSNKMFLRIRRRKRWLVAIFLFVAFYSYVANSGKHNKIDEASERKVPKDKDNMLIRNELPTPVAAVHKEVLNGYGKDYFIGLHHTSNEVIQNPPGHKPKILIWHAPFGGRPTYLANPKVCGGHVDCDITYDRNAVDSSGAIIFHFSSSRLSNMPAKRKPEQLYAWWTGEKNHGNHMNEFDNFFNLTFTYRTDSGIYAPYGSTELILQELRDANELDLEALLEKKRKSNKIAAWAVSNCGVRRRMDLAKNIMEAGLSVDTFGACFDGRQIGSGRYSKSFYESLAEYKFYFSFENGHHCKDYMTEKFWFNSLRSGAVPIVLGPKKEDVLAVAPSKSFIHVEDFENVESLVQYLNYLIKNETAYREYLEWRNWATHPEMMEPRLRASQRDNNLRSFCKLCRILQEEEEAERRGGKRRTMIVKSLQHFWYDMENEECIS